MRHLILILLSLLANGVSWGAGNICTLKNGGTACSSKSCTASLIAADTANRYFTGTGCTANGYTPWTNSDNVVIPSGFTLTDDVGGTYGNYNGPVFSYMSSLAVAANSTTGCSNPTATITGGTQYAYSVNAPILTTDTSGVITAAALPFERVWYTAGSAQPTVTITGGGCTFLNSYTSTTAITPVWVQGGGTPALSVVGGGRFTAASAITARGDIQYTFPTAPATASFIMNAGAGLTWDSSGTTPYSDGLHTVYGFAPNSSGGATNIVFQANGTSASHVTITSNTSGANGTFLAQHDCSYAPKYSITMSYTDLSNLGSAIDPIYDGLLQNSCGDTAIWNVTNSTFTGVGSASVYQGSGTTETLIHQYNVHANQLGVADLALYGASTLGSGGTRSVSNNVFGSQFNCIIAGSINGAGGMTGVTFSGNYLGDTPCPMAYSASSLSGSLSYNLIRHYTYPGSWPVPWSAPSYAGNYFAFVGPAFNPHLVQNNGSLGNVAWSGNVIDLQEDQTGGDTTYFFSSPPRSGPYTVSFLNNIVLRTKQGHGQGWMALSDTAIFGANRPLVMNHNIGWGRNLSGAAPGGNYQGLVLIDHGGTTSQAVSSLKSNIVVGLGGRYTAFKFSSVQFNSPTTPATADLCTPSTCDFNAGYLITNANNCGGVQSATCPNAGNGYNAKFSGGATPGPHDIDVVLGLGSTGVNPQFADPTRNLATWDTAYLHNTASTGAWSNSASYTVGQTASDSHSNVWSNAMIDYRVIAAHTSSTVTEPDLTLTSANGHITQCVISTSPATDVCTTDTAHGLVAGQYVYLWGIGGDNTPFKKIIASDTYTFTVPNNGGGAATLTTGLSAQIWRNFWEYASEYDLRTAIGAGATYTDGSINCVACLPVEALVNWAMAGHIVLNPALWLAGHDGDDVGAASLANVQHIPPMMTVP